MGRELTRSELLEEAAAAVITLREYGARGDRSRFEDDGVFRYAVAFAWLRLAEPLCRLVTQRLVGQPARLAWAGMCNIRNMLAHERDEEINFIGLWTDLADTLARVEVHIDRLMTEG